MAALEEQRESGFELSVKDLLILHKNALSTAPYCLKHLQHKFYEQLAIK
jgi:hypothetical protein